jgi:hypothetical protein
LWRRVIILVTIFVVEFGCASSSEEGDVPTHAHGCTGVGCPRSPKASCREEFGARRRIIAAHEFGARKTQRTSTENPTHEYGTTLQTKNNEENDEDGRRASRLAARADGERLMVSTTFCRIPGARGWVCATNPASTMISGLEPLFAP